MHPCANNQSVYDKEHGAHNSFGRCVQGGGSQGTGGGSRCQDALDGFHNERLSCRDRKNAFTGLGSPVATHSDTNKNQCTQKCNDNTQCKSFVVKDNVCNLYAQQDLPYDHAEPQCSSGKQHLEDKFIGRWYQGYDLGSEVITGNEHTCCSNCGQLPGCRWWTFEHINGEKKCHYRSRLDARLKDKADTGAITGSPYIEEYSALTADYTGGTACDMGPPSACTGHCGPIAGSVENPHLYMSWGEYEGLFTLNWHHSKTNPRCDHDWCVFSGNYLQFSATPPETTTSTTTTVDARIEQYGAKKCKGCPLRGGCAAALASEKLTVRCCMADGSGGCDDVSCAEGLDLLTAAELCASEGKRLCKETELSGCCGTGCGFDFVDMWVAEKHEVEAETNPDNAKRCKGCPSRGGCAPAMLSDTLPGHRCCKDGGTCDDIKRCGVTNVNYATAKDECALAGPGWRICKESELGQCCGKGCGFDFGDMWVSDVR